MKEKIDYKIKEVLKDLGIIENNFSIEHPSDFKNGDYSTNVAMICAKKMGINPRDLAEKIVMILRENQDKFPEIQEIQVAGAGFINFYLDREFFRNKIKEILEKGNDWGKNVLLEGKKIMVEYTDPNPFKPFHIGHLMTNAIGESLSRIVEFSGSETIRANYQGDVGPHVAKAIWGINHVKKLGGLNIYFDKPENAFNIVIPSDITSISDQAIFIGNCYHVGAMAYDTDENIKKEIDEINKKIYDKSDDKINEIYEWGRKVTLDAFEEIYKLLGTKFSNGCYFFESEMAPIGEKIVRENVGEVFKESDGAIVFHGEDYDKKLHTRVFINSQQLPTYETKEIGLTVTKFEKENPDISIVITATEQAEYMKVVQKAISLIHSDYEKRMLHITHGMMRFADGKMSSRKGNVITGESLLKEVQEKVFWKMMHSNPNDNKPVFENNEDLNKKTKEIEEICKKVGVSALKYSILRSSLGSDIIYDQEKSISFEGDSGPYLQYTTVRANSILNRGKNNFWQYNNHESFKEVPENTTDLERYLYQFPEIVKYSYETLQPHHIATYLTELASSFNTFYGNTQILVEENKYMAYHLNLIKAFYQTMKNGLWLLGIEVPKKM